MMSRNAMLDPLWLRELAALARDGVHDDGVFVEHDAPLSVTVRSTRERQRRLSLRAQLA